MEVLETLNLLDSRSLPSLGLPSLNGLMLVLSARTGMTEAVLLDNGYLTAVRTAAASPAPEPMRRFNHLLPVVPRWWPGARSNTPPAGTLPRIARPLWNLEHR